MAGIMSGKTSSLASCKAETNLANLSAGTNSPLKPSRSSSPVATLRLIPSLPAYTGASLRQAS